MSNELQEGSGPTPGHASSDTIEQVRLLCQKKLRHSGLKTIQKLAKSDPEGVLSALLQFKSELTSPALRLLMEQLQLADTIQQVKLLCHGKMKYADLKAIRKLAKADPEGVLTALIQSERELTSPALRLLMGQLQLAKARKIEALDEYIKLAHKHVSQFPDDVFSIRPFLRNALMMRDRTQVEAIDAIFSMLPPTLTVLSYRALWASLWSSHRASEAASRLREEISAVKQQRFGAVLQEDKGFAELIKIVSSARSIAIVGSGPSLQGAGQGAEIDAHDLVVRINFPPISPFAKDVGSRTDVGFTWPAPTTPLFKKVISRHQSYAGALVVQVSRAPRKDYTSFSADDLAAAGVSRFTRLPSHIWNLVLDLSYPAPTTGFGAIVFIALLLDRPVSLFGFDFYATDRKHFWSPMGPSHAPLHEPWFEKRMVENMLAPHFGAIHPA